VLHLTVSCPDDVLSIERVDDRGFTVQGDELWLFQPDLIERLPGASVISAASSKPVRRKKRVGCGGRETIGSIYTSLRLKLRSY